MFQILISKKKRSQNFQKKDLVFSQNTLLAVSGQLPEWTQSRKTQFRRTQSRMVTTQNGHHPEWTPPRMDTTPNGHHPEWTPPRMDTIPNGHYPEWTPSRMDTILQAHNLFLYQHLIFFTRLVIELALHRFSCL